MNRDEAIATLCAAMAEALRENCTNVRGECYAHVASGFCRQEGNWGAEVDGEFDIDVLATAALTAAEPFFAQVRDVEYAPCPTCRQYSHSIGEDRLAEAFNWFQSMYAHRGDGIPTQYNFDEKTRDAAQVLMTAIRSLPPVVEGARG